MCVWLGSSCSFKHVSLNDKEKFFLINVLVSGWNWEMNFPKLSQALLDSS